MSQSLVTTVILRQTTWVQHIAARHTDVVYDHVVAAVPYPCLVTQSNTVVGDIVFVNTFAYNAAGDVLRVPVVLHGDETGTVKSAYFTSASSHRKILWERGDD